MRWGHNADSSSSGMPLKWDPMAVADIWCTAFKDTPDVDSYVAFPPAFQGVQFTLFQLNPVGKLMHSTDFCLGKIVARVRVIECHRLCGNSIVVSSSHGHLRSVASIVLASGICLFFWKCVWPIQLLMDVLFGYAVRDSGVISKLEKERWSYTIVDVTNQHKEQQRS